MMTALVVRPQLGLVEQPDLTEYAAGINSALEECDRAAREVIYWAMEAGRLLEEVKNQLEHGLFEAWVLAHCRVTPRMARLYRQLWRRLKTLKPEMISGFRTIQEALDWCRQQNALVIKLAFESGEQRDAYFAALQRHRGGVSDPVPTIIRALNAIPTR
jgi:hypothetical protein